jgi:hypothetical protein
VAARPGWRVTPPESRLWPPGTKKVLSWSFEQIKQLKLQLKKF